MSDGRSRFERAVAAIGFVPDVRWFPEGTRTAEDAARAIGCDVAQIVKSLVFVADPTGPLLVLASGRHRVDLDKLAAFGRSRSIRRATPEEVRESTGYAIGGTPPFGHPEPMRAYGDETLRAFEIVWAAAGTPDSVFPIAPDELGRLANTEWADLAETRPRG
jgi:prolyl-tRNA editing enzyme YbaK/EbsC (Cys-tRNA(Pro) deacylase)